MAPAPPPHQPTQAEWHLAYIGLGSNLGDPARQLDEARRRLALTPGIIISRVSSYYATPPVGVLEQPWFVNAVAEIQTTLAPEALLDALLQIEQDMGRVRVQRWGPRLVDLDLLLYNNKIIDTPRLIVPHPEMAGREFVLLPLAEIAPQACHPLLAQTAAQLLEKLAPEIRTGRKI